MGQPDADIPVPPPKEAPRVGDFDTLTRTEAVLWLKLLGAADLRSRSASDEDVFRRLRHALWDAQRIDNLFHGAMFSDSEYKTKEKEEEKTKSQKKKGREKAKLKAKPKLNPSTLPTWPDWKEPHPELIMDAGTPLDVDGTEDAERLDTYVVYSTSTVHAQPQSFGR